MCFVAGPLTFTSSWVSGAIASGQWSLRSLGRRWLDVDL
jgi:hypothetical protein